MDSYSLDNPNPVKREKLHEIFRSEQYKPTYIDAGMIPSLDVENNIRFNLIENSPSANNLRNIYEHNETTHDKEPSMSIFQIEVRKNKFSEVINSILH